MAIRKKRRVRSPHPGVKLKRRVLPSGATSWRAVYRDPDTGRETYTTLDPVALPTKETRTRWAIGKAKAIAQRRMELESGAPRATGTVLATAIERYFEAHQQLRPRTLAIYRGAANKLLAWATANGVASGDDLDRARLITFRESLVREPKRAPVKATKGGRRGSFTGTAATRSPAAVNQELRSVRTVLNYLHELDLLPRLSRDDLRSGLKMERDVKEAPEFLRPHELQKLFDAALRHDADTWSETRDEHRGLRLVGSTPKYKAIAPFVAFVLLTGCRAGEAFALRWSDVDLDALDPDGNVAGDVRLTATATKTATARRIGLGVCPYLRKTLAAMKLRAGKSEYVFGGKSPMSRSLAEAARKRLQAEYGAPEFSWQLLRSTCATYQCNATSLFGDATVFKSAKRLGHSVTVAEKLYSGNYDVSREARTLEAAMQIESVMERVAGRVISPELPFAASR